MRNSFVFEAEPFEFDEYEEDLDIELADETWQGEVNRSSGDYVRWVQSALNKVMGLRLTVDGLMGSQTRSAIRSFQRRQGLAVEGNIGWRTERALLAAGAGALTDALSISSTSALIRRDCFVLDRFLFNDDKVRPALHFPQIRSLVHCLNARQNTSQSIRQLCLIGHTDAEGNAVNNPALGLKRAKQVAMSIRRIAGELEKREIRIVMDTRGETQPVANSMTGRAKACNRRVAIFLDNTPTSCNGRRLRGCTFSHFLTEYDLRFMPDDNDNGIPANPNTTQQQKEDRTTDIHDMRAALLPRRDARASTALGLPSPTPIPPVPTGTATRLSTAQIALYRTCFPDGRGGINFHDFQRCFEQFANGELRDLDRPNKGYGEPDGGRYFLFAEFAFRCIASGIEPATWTQALRIFVQTQEIFIHVYRPTPHRGPPPVNSPLPRVCKPPLRRLNEFAFANFNATGQSIGARKATLRSKYDPMDLSALRNAARDNMVWAQCMP